MKGTDIEMKVESRSHLARGYVHALKLKCNAEWERRVPWGESVEISGCKLCVSSTDFDLNVFVRLNTHIQSFRTASLISHFVMLQPFSKIKDYFFPYQSLLSNEEVITEWNHLNGKSCTITLSWMFVLSPNRISRAQPQWPAQLIAQV